MSPDNLNQYLIMLVDDAARLRKQFVSPYAGIITTFVRSGIRHHRVVSI